MTTQNESKSAARQEDATRDHATLANRAHEVADEARQVALDRVESARTSVQEAKERAAEKVRTFGGTVRKVGEHFRVEDQLYIAEKANDVSQRLDSVATYLSSAEIATLANDMRVVARRNPGWFYGGAFALGLAAGRFLKATSGDASREASAGKQRRLPPSTRTTDSSATPRADARTTPGTRGRDKEQPSRSGANR